MTTCMNAIFVIGTHIYSHLHNLQHKDIGDELVSVEVLGIEYNGEKDWQEEVEGCIFRSRILKTCSVMCRIINIFFYNLL